MIEPDLLERLREVHAELRTLPLGGRGHIVDTVQEACAALAEVRANACAPAIPRPARQGPIRAGDWLRIRFPASEDQNAEALHDEHDGRVHVRLCDSDADLTVDAACCCVTAERERSWTERR